MERRLDARDGKVWLDGSPIAEFLHSEYDRSKDLEDWMNDMLDVAYHPLTRYLAGVENELYHGKPERQGKEVFKWFNSYNSSSRELPIEIKKVRSSKNLPSVKDCVLQWYRLFIWRDEFRFVDNVNEVISEICHMHRSAFETKPEDADTDEHGWEYEDGANPPKFSCPSSLFLPEIDGGYVYFKYYRDYPILKALDEKAVKKVFDECAPVPAFGVLEVAWSSEWMKLMQYVEDANTRKNKICYKMAKKTKKEKDYD